MTPAEALAELRDSRDGARIWHDNGASVTARARLAGVRVVYAHVNLTTLATEYRTVEAATGMPQRDVKTGADGPERGNW
jgi:hypothetical protein